MSKQSNQRYRKEKESEHLKKAGVDSQTSGTAQGGKSKAKTNHP